MIPGYFDPRSGWPVPWIRVFLLLPGISSDWEPVDFLLDTGCTTTILHPTDAVQRIGIGAERLQQPELWSEVTSSIGVGGSTSIFPVPAQYGFIDESGDAEIIDGRIRVAQLTPANQGLPSLLGWDVLKEFEVLINRRACGVLVCGVAATDALRKLDRSRRRSPRALSPAWLHQLWSALPGRGASATTCLRRLRALIAVGNPA